MLSKWRRSLRGDVLGTYHYKGEDHADGEEAKPADDSTDNVCSGPRGLRE